VGERCSPERSSRTTTDRDLIFADVARRTDPEVEHAMTPEPTEVIGLHPRLVLRRQQTYLVNLSFWLSLALPGDQVAGVVRFFTLDGRRSMGSCVESVADLTPGYGLVRDAQTFVVRSGFDAILTAGLLITGRGGRYSVAHLLAHAWDPTLETASSPGLALIVVP